MLDRTHSPEATSWLEEANALDCPFPIQNLPFGVFRRRGTSERARVGVAIGTHVFSVSDALEAGEFTGRAVEAAHSCTGSTLDGLIALGAEHSMALRQQCFDLLNSKSVQENPLAVGRARQALLPMETVELLRPISVPNYTDFFTSQHHAQNAARIFGRPVSLPANFHHLPIGYHGRASSVRVSGQPVRRPRGQFKDNEGRLSSFEPSAKLDFEVELGLVARGGNIPGATISMDNAREAIFGVCLLNDWSARDIQVFEAQPLGPFLSKSFATSISPWIITSEALEPFRVELKPRPADIPDHPVHLKNSMGPLETWDISIDCLIQPKEHHPSLVARCSTRSMHWTFEQLISHHASNGCDVLPGDLMGTGTLSADSQESLGCLLELTDNGRSPICIGSVQRTYLEDGDTVIMQGWCRREGTHSIGLGEVVGAIAY